MPSRYNFAAAVRINQSERRVLDPKLSSDPKFLTGGRGSSISAFLCKATVYGVRRRVHVRQRHHYVIPRYLEQPKHDQDHHGRAGLITPQSATNSP